MSVGREHIDEAYFSNRTYNWLVVTDISKPAGIRGFGLFLHTSIALYSIALVSIVCRAL